MTIEIRRVRSDEIGDICKIAVEAWRPIYDNYKKILGSKLFNILHRDWQAKKGSEIRRHFESYPDWMLITEMDGKIVGFITFILDKEKRIGIIGNNAVQPQCQRKGIGTMQYRKVLEIFRRNRMKFAEVTTGLDEAHTPARSAYEKLGFKRAIPTVTYYMELS